MNDTFNKQNDWIYAVTHEEADDIGGVHRETQFSPGVMNMVRGVLLRINTTSDHRRSYHR